MNKENVLKDFTKSNLLESDYFNTSKDNIILLRDYINNIEKSKKEFNKLVKDDIKRIKEKNKFIDKVYYKMNNLILYCNSKPHIIVYKDDNNKLLFCELYKSNNLFIKMKANRRVSLLMNSATELEKIYEIGNKLLGEYICKDSVSGYFCIHGFDNILLSNYLNNQMYIYDDESFYSLLDGNCYYYINCLLDKIELKNSSKVLEKKIK